MKSLIIISVLFLSQFCLAQGPGEIHVYSGFGNYTLGSIRSASDTNIYLQSNGIIHENGKQLHIYHFKGLNLIPYELNGIKFQNLHLFYESEKLVRINLIKSYVEKTAKSRDSLRRIELNILYKFLNQISDVKGRKKIFTNNNFVFEKGYQWKETNSLMQLKTYNNVQSGKADRMLIISIKLKGY